MVVAESHPVVVSAPSPSSRIRQHSCLLRLSFLQKALPSLFCNSPSIVLPIDADHAIYGTMNPQEVILLVVVLAAVALAVVGAGIWLHTRGQGDRETVEMQEARHMQQAYMRDVRARNQETIAGIRGVPKNDYYYSQYNVSRTTVPMSA